MRSASLARVLVLWNLLVVAASAQFTTTFDRTLQTPLDNSHTSVEQCVARSDGGFYVVLLRHVFNGQVYLQGESFLSRLDAQGQPVWTNPISAAGELTGLAIDAADNAYVAVGLSGPTSVASYASDASLRWSSTIPAGGQPLQDGIGVSTSGTVVVARWIASTVRVARLDANGAILHDVQVPLPANLARVSVRPDGSVAGTTQTEMYLALPDGSLAWSVPHQIFAVYGVISGPAGEVAAVGLGGVNTAVVRVRSAAGSLLWAHAMPGPLQQNWWAGAFDPWGGLAVAGEQYNGNWSQTQGFVARFDASGTLLWSRTHGLDGVRDWFRHARVYAAGNLTAVGTTSVGEFYRTVVATWDYDGNLSWAHLDAGPDSEHPLAVLESASSDLVVAGRRERNVFIPFPNPGQTHIEPLGGIVTAIRPDFRTTCLGDGIDAACPCGNVSSPGAREGCANSTGRGARLTASGTPRLSADTLLLALDGSTPGAPGVYFQGSLAVPALAFGDGARCAGGSLRRLYTRSAQAGASSAPPPGDPSISARAAASGDAIQPGSSRVYQVIYRDVSPTFCPSPLGGLQNSSSAVVVAWSL